MDSDEEEYYGTYEYESGEDDGSENESNLDDMIENPQHSCREEPEDASFFFEVLTSNQILQHMNDFLKDVNTVAMVMILPWKFSLHILLL